MLWGPLALLAVLIRVGSMSADFDAQGQEVLRAAISHEYRAVQLAREDGDTGTRARLVESAGNVRFRSLRARASGDAVIVRVELEPNPAAPAGEPAVRYFRLQHSLLSGWVYASRSSALSYYSALPFRP